MDISRGSPTSDRLEMIRFPLIFLVILIHSYNATTIGTSAVSPQSGYSLSSFSFVDSFKYFFSKILALIAVPIFYYISGYLLSHNWDMSWRSYYFKLKTRIKTLAIPYVTFNSLFFISLLLLQLSGVAGGIMNPSNEPLYNYNFIEAIDWALGLNRLRPILYQFWFIRDLISLIIISPVIYFVLSISPIIFIFTLLIMWVCDINLLLYPAIEPIFFFSIGMWVGLRRMSPFISDRFSLILVISYIFYLAVSLPLAATSLSIFASKVGILLGVSSALAITKSIAPTRTGAWFIRLAPYSFFTFELHEPLLTGLKKVWLKSLGGSDAFQAMGYLLIPIIVVVLTIGIYKVLEKIAPAVLSFLTGQRT